MNIIQINSSRQINEFVYVIDGNQNSSNQIDNRSLTIKILIGVVCFIVIMLSLMGNSLVVTVILRYKRLKNATNYILLSLAIADLTVSFLVMLPAMIQDVFQKWIFSQLFCKFYNAFDITCCTASILHLLLVAIDRYIAIFKPLTYRNVVRKWHVFMMVIFVWALSLSMSFIPIFMGWNQLDKSNNTLNGTKNDTCALEANVPYAIISSSLSFFIPLVIMAVVYLQIFIVARHQAHAISKIQFHAKDNHHENNSSQNNNLNINQNESLNEKQISKILKENDEIKSSDDKCDKKIQKMIKTIERKRTKDTKAIKTLGIIMGKLNKYIYLLKEEAELY